MTDKPDPKATLLEEILIYLAKEVSIGVAPTVEGCLLSRSYDALAASETRVEALRKAGWAVLDFDARSSTEKGHKRDMVRAMELLYAALDATRS